MKARSTLHARLHPVKKPKKGKQVDRHIPKGHCVVSRDHPLATRWANIDWKPNLETGVVEPVRVPICVGCYQRFLRNKRLTYARPYRASRQLVEMIGRLRDGGARVEVIVELTGISRRQVYRYINHESAPRL